MISVTNTNYFIASMIEAVLDNSTHKKFLFSFSFRAHMHVKVGKNKNIKSVHVPAPDFHILIDGTSSYVGVWKCVVWPNIPEGTGIRHYWDLKDSDWIFETKHDTWKSSCFSELFNIWIHLRDEIETKAKKMRIAKKDLPRWMLSDAVTLSPALTHWKRVEFSTVRPKDGFGPYGVKDFKILD